jgi:hypothetical protein
MCVIVQEKGSLLAAFELDPLIWTPMICAVVLFSVPSPARNAHFQFLNA